MKKTENMSARHLAFLEKVFERRDILFKKGTNNNGSIQRKEQEWENIRQECVEAGYFELKDKSFRHLRDITWQNFRRRAVAKVEMVRKGGKDAEQLTECDKLVLAIINNLQLPASRLSTNSQLPTQVVVDDELEEPQISGEMLNIKAEPIDLLPMINGQSFASLFDTRSNTTQSESTDEQPTVIESDSPNQLNLSMRRPLFEDEMTSVSGNQRPSSGLAKRRNLKRKRQLAEIAHRNAETERMLAEADKLRAEAILIRLQANEIEHRLKQINNDDLKSNSATVLITDGKQL